MRIIKENNVNKLIADEGYLLINKADLEKPEEDRYYFKFAYIPDGITLEDCQNIYKEIEDESSID